MRANDVIALTGIGVTLIVSVANLLYSLWSGKRTIFVNTVTTSRLKWIDSLRDEVSEFMATTALLMETRRSSDIKRSTELLLKRDTLLHEIVLHLNPLDDEDMRIKSVVDRIRELTDREGATDELRHMLGELRDATATYLKKEWNRVKDESGARMSPKARSHS
jgi:hypothetical protein